MQKAYYRCEDHPSLPDMRQARDVDMRGTARSLRTLLLWAMMPLTLSAGIPCPCCLWTPGDALGDRPATDPGQSGVSVCQACLSKTCLSAEPRPVVETSDSPRGCRCAWWLTAVRLPRKATPTRMLGLEQETDEATIALKAASPTALQALILLRSAVEPRPLAGRDVLCQLMRWQT